MANRSHGQLLLVEDDVHTQQVLARALGRAKGVRAVAVAGDLASGLSFLRTRPVGMLVTDLGLPDGSGLELIRAARAADAGLPILVVTVFGTEDVLLDAIASGADGYLLKGDDEAAIARALEQLLRGEAPISPSVARHLLRRFRAPHATSSGRGEGAPELSRRETEVLQLVGKGLRVCEIATTLRISYHTVNTHVRSVYRKLDVTNRTEAVYEATRLGVLNMEF